MATPERGLDASALFELSHAVGVAAFACEAYRVLQETHDLCHRSPALAEALNGQIDARCQWMEVPGHEHPVSAIAALLSSISSRLYDCATNNMESGHE